MGRYLHWWMIEATHIVQNGRAHLVGTIAKVFNIQNQSPAPKSVELTIAGGGLPAKVLRGVLRIKWLMELLVGTSHCRLLPELRHYSPLVVWACFALFSKCI